MQQQFMYRMLTNTAVTEGTENSDMVYFGGFSDRLIHSNEFSNSFLQGRDFHKLKFLTL